MSPKKPETQSILSDMPPAKAIVKLAIPATLALLAKAVYNLVDTAYIGMLNSNIALTAVGVTVPLLLIMISVENIFAAGAAALANLPAQSMKCAARAESSVKISSIAVITGAALNILLDPVFMFDWGLSLGVEGASLATTVSQFVTFFILTCFYASERSVIKIRLKAFRSSWGFIKSVAIIGIPTAVIQICLSIAASLTNIAAAALPQSGEIIAAYGVVQRLVLIGCYVIMGFMQGYQPVASYAFGAKKMKTVSISRCASL